MVLGALLSSQTVFVLLFDAVDQYTLRSVSVAKYRRETTNELRTKSVSEWGCQRSMCNLL